MVRFAAVLRADVDRLPVDLLRDAPVRLDVFFAADRRFAAVGRFAAVPRFADAARFFGGPPLSRALSSAIATACFCAFFRLAGLLLPIDPLRSYECISARMLLLIVSLLDPFFKGMMSLLDVIPTWRAFPFARPMLGASLDEGLSEKRHKSCGLLPTVRAQNSSRSTSRYARLMLRPITYARSSPCHIDKSTEWRICASLSPRRNASRMPE